MDKNETTIPYSSIRLACFIIWIMLYTISYRVLIPSIIRKSVTIPSIQARFQGLRQFSQDAGSSDNGGDGEINLSSQEMLEGLGQNIMGTLRRPKAKRVRADRRSKIPWETSIRYMDSDAYKTTYGDYLVWQLYRRAFGGQFQFVPRETRVSCVGEDGFISTGSPCPICRDEYLVLHHFNVKLLRQFLSPFTGKILPARKTNLCRVKHEELLVAIHKAKDYGTITFHIEPRTFNYRDYYLPEDIAHLKLEEGFDLEKDEVLQKALRDPDFSSEHEFALDNWQVIK